MFSIPNTSIIFQTYDLDAGRTPALQTFPSSQLLTGGYVFCSTAAVYVRLTVGPIGQQRQLPEFFLAPGSQGVAVESKAGGNPISLIEVRAATGTAAQFWGALATDTDPIGPFYPASYSVDSSGALVPPPAIGLTFEQDGAVKSFRQIANFVAVGGVAWNISDDVPGTRATIQLPPVGVQVADAGQINEQILDFQNAGGITWSLVDDPANHRVKITGTSTSNRELGYAEFTSGVSCTATTAATANTVVSLGAISFDGSTPCIVEFYCPRMASTAAVANEGFLELYDGASDLGTVLDQNVASGLKEGPVYCYRRLTPSNGSHTFSWRGWAGNVNGVTYGAGTGGAGVIMPGFIRCQRAA